MTAFLSLDWRNENSGSHASLVDRAPGGRFELVFCGTDCLRDHLNEKLDELEGHRGPGWRTADGRSPIEWDELDPGIRDVVRYLRGLGFDTHYSCEGGKGHMCQYPLVALLAHTETLESLRRRAVSALLRGGYRDFRSTIRFSHGATDRPYSGWGGGLEVAIEFVIDRKPIRPYVKRTTDSSRSKKLSFRAAARQDPKQVVSSAEGLTASKTLRRDRAYRRVSTRRRP